MLPALGEMKTASVYHLPTTGGASQAYPASPDLTCAVRLLPLDRRDHALIGVDTVEPREIYLDPGIDVRLQDKVMFDGDTSNYYVKHVFKADFGVLPHQRVTISKNE